MTTVYLVQDNPADGGDVAGVFSTRQTAEDWMKVQAPHVSRDWALVPFEIDSPAEKDDAKIKANLEAKGHSFVFDPHHRCVHCGRLIGLLQELEECALISDNQMTAPRCRPANDPIGKLLMTTLKESLSEWTDWDGAAFLLAVSLGLMKAGPESWLKNKGVFWSANPRESSLACVLQELVKAGILEHRSEPDSQYRWNRFLVPYEGEE